MPGKTVWQSSHDAPVRSASIGIARAGAGRNAANAQTPALIATTSDAVATAWAKANRLFLIPHPTGVMRPQPGAAPRRQVTSGYRLGEGGVGRRPVRYAKSERCGSHRALAGAIR